MKIDPKFFKAHVLTSEGGAHLICSVYSLDHAREFVGVEYFEMVWTLPSAGLSIPSSRQASFQEELRVVHQAASTYKGRRDLEQEHIADKLREAYGASSQVSITEIRPESKNVDL